MKRYQMILAAALVCAAALAVGNPSAQARRQGGPLEQVMTVPAYDSVYFNVPMMQGEPTTISIVGNGNANLQLFIYDNDGHVIVGNGSPARQSATINVYRGGTFRVQVRNLGTTNATFQVVSN